MKKPTDKIQVEITYNELAKIYAVMGNCNGRQSSSLYGLAVREFNIEDEADSFLNDIEKKDVTNYYDYEVEWTNLLFKNNKKTEQQIQIEKLEETIKDAQKQVEALKSLK